MRKILTLSLFIFYLLQMSAQHNVILIIADDLGTDYLGCYPDHNDTVPLPNIRSLLSKGIRFDNAMSNPVCSSTRAGILTGRYSFRTGVGNIVGGIGGSGSLDSTEITIPRLLRAYNPTIGLANIGKWHLQLPMPASNYRMPNVMGYDHYEGPFIGALPNFYNWMKITDGIADTVRNYATSENVNNAISWLKTQGSRPVFLWLAFNAPHTPYHLPPAGLHTYTTLSGTTSDINTNPKAYFKADLQALDHEIGRFFDSLRVLGRMDSTDIIFIGDNGNAIRVAQIADTGRAKGTVYQYGIHVPFIISGPSVSSPGRSSSALVNTADIFATVLELFGDTAWHTSIPLAKPVDSKSILPVLKNTATGIRPWSFCEMFKLTPDSDDGKAMRNMDYKLIRFDDGREEFYHLSADPSELTNLMGTSMTADDITNYSYLCTEMTNLIGHGTYCTTGVGIRDLNSAPASVRAYPNPFTNHISISGGQANDEYELTAGNGQILFRGKDIETQDFSKLASGLYYVRSLHSSSGKGTVLIKE